MFKGQRGMLFRAVHPVTMDFGVSRAFEPWAAESGQLKMPVDEPLQDVHAFWNTEACGTHFVPHYSDLSDFYEKFREHRYRTEWHIPLLVPFAEFRKKRVLEIGIGNGADGAMFAKHGASYVGVDLTDAALEATKRHFDVLGIQGTFQKENAEHLSFPEASFDLVYSHGVLHHTPNTQRAIDEVYRVLKPGGEAIVMLYHKRSFNYYVRIMTWMRFRVLTKIALRLGRWRRDRDALLDHSGLEGVRGNASARVWDIHYQNFLRRGWSYLRAYNFIHHSTDGPECPVAYAFDQQEARRLFTRFSRVRTQVAHFPIRKYSRLLPFGVEKFLSRRIGWYLFIFAQKQPA
jgi:ubiquinone/menaquinone biosynthesis C-methylase UbiE